MNSSADVTPWYQQLWPWILIALPSSAVIACAITVWFVLQNPDREVAHEAVPVNQVMGKSSVVPPQQ